MSKFGLSGPPPDSPSSTPNTHASMLFLLYELGNGLEWVKNTGTLIPKTSEVYFLLCWASGRHFVNFFCDAATQQNSLIFGEQTQLIEIYPKMNFSRFYQRFSQVPKFLTTFFPKVQISKFCLYKSMNWLQASMLKGFLRGLGTCHTFHNWVTKFSVFACPQLYINLTMHRKSLGPALCMVRMSTVVSICLVNTILPITFIRHGSTIVIFVEWRGKLCTLTNLFCSTVVLDCKPLSCKMTVWR